MTLRNCYASISLISFLAFAVITNALGANNPTVLTIDGISSEILKWSWGASNSTSIDGEGGSGGAAEFQDMSITRLTGSQSPTLLSHVAKGEYLSEVSIVRGILKITLAPVVLTSYSVDAMFEKDSPQTETIGLGFGTVTYEFDGVSFCWDSSQNLPCTP